MRIYVTSEKALNLAQEEHRDIVRRVRAGAVDSVVELTRQHLNHTFGVIAARPEEARAQS